MFTIVSIIIHLHFSINLSSGELEHHHVDDVDWKVTLVNTGDKSMTGGRTKRMRQYVGNETFMLTYGDGVANIDIDLLLEFHKSHGKMVTMTAVRPGARFGELELSGDKVESFEEKPQMHEGWINGGFFCLNKKVCNYILDETTSFESEPLNHLVSIQELSAFEHHGWWQPMDTLRDKRTLVSLWEKGGAPWLRK